MLCGVGLAAIFVIQFESNILNFTYLFVTRKSYIFGTFFGMFQQYFRLIGKSNGWTGVYAFLFESSNITFLVGKLDTLNAEHEVYIITHSFISADIYHCTTSDLLFVATASVCLLPAVHET